MPVLITAEALKAAMDAGESIRLLDVRWGELGIPPGHPLYLEGHIPGSVFVDLQSQLATLGEAADGRHPLPSVESLQTAARSWGVNDGDTVVVYDDRKNLSSARAWWLLRYAGIADVRVLDGALHAWIEAGFGLETGEPTINPGTVTLSYGHTQVLDIDAAAVFPKNGVLLDARAPARYRGEVEPVDPRAGHIPGALNAPATENVDSAGRFLPAEELHKRFISLGVREDAPVGVYCGSGVTAAHNAIALTIAGFEPALYPGSWSQWSNHQDRPISVGQTP